MFKTILLLIFTIPLIKCTGTVKVITQLRTAIRFDTKMPSLYIDKQLKIDEKMFKSIYSLEHVFPQSFLDKKDCNDMHNVIRTMNEFNICRSNYKYSDFKNNTDWKELSFENYVNHKKKLFIPNSCSRGFIARALLHMKKEYNYNIEKVIDIETMVDWFYKYPPTINEKYHNNYVLQLQNKNNIFVSKYKNKKTRKYVDDLC